MNLDVPGFRGLSDENIGENDGYDQKNDNDNHALLQPTLRLAHPSDALIFLLLGAHRGTMRVMGHLK